jgi:hypothetical protein
MALSEINREAVNIHFQVRMTLVLSEAIRIKFCKISIRQLENHMYDRGRIDRRAYALCRLESHLASCLDGCLVQPVTQTAHYAIHMHLPVRAEKHLE